MHGWRSSGVSRSKRHAQIYWSEQRKSFCIKSICKNAVRVNGVSYPGSPEGNAGSEAALFSQACIEIADSPQMYFLLPKGESITLAQGARVHRHRKKL